MGGANEFLDMKILFVSLVIIISIAIPHCHTGDISWESKTPYITSSGCAAYYNTGVMARSAANLGIIEKRADYKKWLSDNGYIGAVAVYRAGDVGRTVHILWYDGTIDGPYIAIDTVSMNHYDMGIDRNRVVDIDHNTAVAHDIDAPVNVVIIYDMENLFDRIGHVNKIDLLAMSKYEGCLNR